MNRMQVTGLKLWLVGLVATFVLGGCAELGKFWSQLSQRPPDYEATRSENGDVPWLLSYAEWIRTLPPDELQQLFTSTEAGFEQEDTPARRIRLALLLSLDDAPFRDDTRAQQLLQQYLEGKTTGPTGYRDFAALWLQVLEERERWHEDQVRLEQALAKERKQRESSQQQLETSKEQLQTLQQQLDALKAIEENISEREKATPAPLK